MIPPVPARRWGPRLARAFTRAAPPAPVRVIDRFAAPMDDLLTLMLEQVNAGVLVMDRQGGIIRVNAILRRLAGRGAAAGQPVMKLFMPEERAAIWSRLQGALLGGSAIDSLTAGLEHESGEPGVSVDISVHALREADGAISGAMLRFADITVQKRLETQLAQSQKLQAVGQLAAGIAHDFNNLLTAMIGAADMIGGRAALDPQTLEDAREIRDCAQRGGNLVRQLLAFGRQQSLLPAIISINDAIRGLSGLLVRLLGSQVRLVLELETPVLQARVDPTQLDQVLINLAVNARDAMGQGGTLTLRSGHITLHRPLVRGSETIPPGRYVMIEVQDTGTGIDPAVLSRIFDPFFSTKRDRGGTGLGLSTVHGIIRQSGGFLGVESELGHGTRLRVYLPRHDAVEGVVIPPAPVAALPPPRPVDRAVSRPDARVVLLVDDEAPVRRMAERALLQAGWRVLAADSAEAALELMAAVRDAGTTAPSLVISDVMMPGLDGPALVSRLRATVPGLPAILISGYADERLRGALADARVAFLAKPYGLSELIAAAESVLLGAVIGAGPN